MTRLQGHRRCYWSTTGRRQKGDNLDLRHFEYQLIRVDGFECPKVNYSFFGRPESGYTIFFLINITRGTNGHQPITLSIKDSYLTLQQGGTHHHWQRLWTSTPPSNGMTCSVRKYAKQRSSAQVQPYPNQGHAAISFQQPTGKTYTFSQKISCDLTYL